MKKLPSGITMYWTAVLGLFFYFSVAYFDAGMPLDWEEAVLSAPAAEILAGTDLDPMYSTLSIGGRNWPVLEAIHGIGVLETYLMLPIFRLFGISPYVLRAVEVMGCILIALLFGYAALLIFDRPAGYVTFPLILFNNTYYLWGRWGFMGATLAQWFCLSSALICLAHWKTKGRSGWLYLAQLFLGIGMYAKLYFLGVVVGCWIWLLLWHPPLGWKQGLLAVLCTIVGFSPFLIWNSTHDYQSIQYLAGSFGRASHAYVSQLIQRSTQWIDTLLLLSSRWAPSSLPRSVHTLLYGSLLTLAPLLQTSRLRLARDSLYLLIFITASFIGLIGLKFTNLAPDHVLPIFPIPVMFLAFALTGLTRNKKLLCMIVIGFLAPDIVLIRNNLKSYPTRPASSLIDGDHLLALGYKQPIVINCFAVGPNIEIATGGKIFPYYAGGLPLEDFKKACSEWLGDEQRIYLISRGANNPKHLLEAFEEILHSNGRQLKVIRKFDTEMICRVSRTANEKKRLS